MQDDLTHERALAQFEKLMDLRPTFLHHKSVLVSIDYALGNVFKPQNHDEIGKYITKIKELVDFVQKMDELGVGTTGIELPLPNLHVSEAKPQCQKVNAKYEKLRDVRHRLAELGIPTVGVETAMADILMKHGAALVVKSLEEPAIVKQQPSSVEVKFESSGDVPWQLGGRDFPTPPYTTGSAPTMKRSASMDDGGDETLECTFRGEATDTKRKKASLNVWSRKGKKCMEAWRVPVNEVATEGLRIMSKESDGSLLLSFDTKTQGIVVVFKEHCLSTRYPWLELMPVDIHTIKRNSLKTKKDLKARLFTRDDQNKLHAFDLIFPTTKDCETFLEKIQFSCYHRIDSSSPNGDVMEGLFEEGLWLEKKTKISGVVLKTRSIEIVELE